MICFLVHVPSTNNCSFVDRIVRRLSNYLSMATPEPAPQLANSAPVQPLTTRRRSDVHEQARKLGKDTIAGGAEVRIDLLVIVILRIFTLVHRVSVVLVYELRPLITHSGRLVEVVDVDTRCATARLQVDDHAGVSCEKPVAAVALYIGVSMSDHVLLCIRKYITDAFRSQNLRAPGYSD